MRHGWLVAMLALLPGVACLAADATATQRIELKLVELSDPPFMFQTLLTNGQGEIDFPNKLGKLKVLLKDGKLWVDSNADGKIDEQDHSVIPDKNAKVAATALIEGREVQMPIFVGKTYPSSKDNSWVEFGPGSAQEGIFQGSRLHLIFCSFAPKGAGEDFPCIHIESEKGDADLMDLKPFSKTIAVSGRLYTLEKPKLGWELRLTPYTGPVAMLKVKMGEPVKEGRLWIQSVNQLQQDNLDSKNPGVFIPGQYRIQGILLLQADRDKKRSLATMDPAEMVFGQLGKKDPITLSAGENVLTFGGPFKLEVAAIRDGSAVSITKANITGVAGEQYSISSIGKDQTFAVFVRGGGKEQELCKLSYG